jgi:hypothetical protein
VNYWQLLWISLMNCILLWCTVNYYELFLNYWKYITTELCSSWCKLQTLPLFFHILCDERGTRVIIQILCLHKLIDAAASLKSPAGITWCQNQITLKNLCIFSKLNLLFFVLQMWSYIKWIVNFQKTLRILHSQSAIAYLVPAIGE